LIYKIKLKKYLNILLIPVKYKFLSMIKLNKFKIS
jgi:hypothetical protein